MYKLNNKFKNEYLEKCTESLAGGTFEMKKYWKKLIQKYGIFQHWLEYTICIINIYTYLLNSFVFVILGDKKTNNFGLQGK